MHFHKKNLYRFMILIITLYIIIGLAEMVTGIDVEPTKPLIDQSGESITQLDSNTILEEFISVSPVATTNPIGIIGDEEFLENVQIHDWLGSGSSSDPFIISGLNFSRNSSTSSPSMFSIMSVTYNFVVENNLFIENNPTVSLSSPAKFSPSVSLINVPNAVFTNNVVMNYSTFRVASANTRVENNIFDCEYCNWDGILISGGGLSFSDNYFSGVHDNIELSVDNSKIIGNYAPIPLSKSWTGSSVGHIGVAITGDNNYIAGNVLSAVHEGLIVIGNNNIIYNNNVSGGLEGAVARNAFLEGIEITGQNTLVIGNTITDSRSYGVRGFSPSLNSLVTYNNFINNTYLNDYGDERQGLSVEGVTFSMNYWEDHDLTDSNQDGIADTPYALTTEPFTLDSNDTDPYPLTNLILDNDPRIFEILMTHKTYILLSLDLTDEFTTHPDTEDQLIEVLDFPKSSIILITVGTLLALIGLGTSVYLIYYFQTAQKVSSLVINEVTKNTLTQIFNGKTPGYLALATRIHNGKEEYTSGTLIPEAIFEFKFLLHPVRLSLMKILVENPLPTASELKSRLNLSWGEFTNHLNSLKKKSFITLKNQFVDGMTKRVVVIDPVGLNQYEKLTEILHEFLNSKAGDTYLLNQ